MSNTPQTEEVSGKVETLRVIGPLAGFAVVAGSMLGVGIFLFPGKIAFEINSVPIFFMFWILGGLFALAGSVACGELGAMIPKSGGDYVFQREALGSSTAFASGWVLFVAIFCGSIASLSVAVFQYQGSALAGKDLMQPAGGLPFSWAQLLALALIIVITAINHVGAKVSAVTQIFLTLTPIAVLTLLAIWVLGASPQTVTSPPAQKAGASTLTIAGLAASFLYINFAFSGWINIIYVSGEVKDPGKNIPRSMVSAVFGVTGLYVLLCVAFISVLGFNGLAALGWTDAGTGTAQALGSKVLETGVLVLIAVAIVTSINATVLASARVAYAMGKGGAFWKGAAALSGPRKVPRRALWLQAALASGFVLTGTFEEIVKMTSVAMFITGTLTVLSMFVLRYTRPDAPRPYKANLYPYLPGLYVVLSMLAVAATLWDAVRKGGADAYYPLIGLGVLIAAFAGHFLYSRKFASATGNTDS